MAIPITYNVRNLRMRLGATVMTALGIALTVAIAIFIMALLAGLKQAFTATGDPMNVMALRKGSDTELTSVIDRPTLPVIKFLPGVAKDANGQPLASGEMIVLIVLPRKDGTGEVNVTVRGMSPIGFKLRPDIGLADGRWFQPGQREVVVSRSVNQRFAHAETGDKLHFGKGDWDVVGIFDSLGGSAHDSEMRGDVNLMATDFDRPIYNSILMRAVDTNSADALVKRMSDDQRLKLDGMHESAYYGKQTRSGAPIKFIGTVIAIIMAIGSCFAAMNTMYASVAFRSREIATLRILGFSRPEHSDVLRAGVAADFADRRHCCSSDDAAVQRLDYGHIELSNVQRSDFPDANYGRRGDFGADFCSSDGCNRRNRAGVARVAAKHSGGIKRLIEFGSC